LLRGFHYSKMEEYKNIEKRHEKSREKRNNVDKGVKTRAILLGIRYFLKKLDKYAKINKIFMILDLNIVVPGFHRRYSSHTIAHQYIYHTKGGNNLRIYDSPKNKGLY